MSRALGMDEGKQTLSEVCQEGFGEIADGYQARD